MYTENILIPEQRTGSEKDFEHTITAPDCDSADEFFLIAKDRLLHPDQWQMLSGNTLAEFQLTDSHAHILTRTARRGDYIRIAISGPNGSADASGYDWVHIEGLIYETDPDAEAERISIQVRPCSAPDAASPEVHHFFGEEATSTFVVTRVRCELHAGVHGRNEKPNTDSGSLLDDARNLLVASGALAGLAGLQWNALLKGLLHFDETEAS